MDRKRYLYRNQIREMERSVTKMLKWASIPTAVVFVAAIAALTWTMTLSPARAAAQGVQGARAYITVQIVNGVDSVSWYDPDGCSSDYNIYLSASTPVPGSTPQITRTHLGSAASGSTAATLPISHSGGGGLLKPTVIVELYCGEYDSGSSTNDRVARTALSVSWSGLWSGTFSSAPLTALSVSGATLSPSFNRGKISYTAEVAGDVRIITVNATGLSGYQFDYIKNTIWNVFWSCDPLGCYYSYGDGTETGIVLTDSDPNTAGFQIELEGGENRLGIGMHKGDEDAGVRLYGLTVTVANIPATGKPTVSGTTQVGQTLRAGTSAISDEDGLKDADFSYQWLRVNTDSTESEISGATRSSYTLVSADTGKSLKVRVTFTDDSGNSESLTSAATSTVTAAAELSADATLSGLTLSGVNFGAFAAATTSYSARVNNSVSETTVTPTLNHSGASYVIKTGGTEDADGTVSLAVGSNDVTVVVTAEDGQTTKTYTVSVTRLDADSDPISSDASLSGLTLSGIDFGTFESDNTSYSASVAYSVAQTTVTPTVSDSGASYAIKRNGVTDSDGTISLRVGSNVIAVVVTAEDESTTQTYNVTVTRADPPSTDATLKTMAVNGDKFTRSGSKGPHYPISYVRSFRNNVTEVTVTATVNHPGASYVIKVGGGEDEDGIVPLAVGGNHVTIEVTAEDGVSTSTYNLSLTRDELSTDARLNRLLLSGIDFGSFISTIESYTANVANSVSRTTVTPTVMDSGASYVIKLGGVEDADGTVSLAVGDNVITIEVTAEDGQTTRTYTVTVTRAAPSSSDATLKALSLSGISLGNFKSVTTSYTASVANSVTQTTVTPTLNDDGVSYVIKIGGVEDADGTVSLAVGSNVITVEVTAADDSTTRTYTVTVTRAVTPAPALQTTMATGLNSSYAPPNAGYSQFGNFGSLSDRSFTIDGRSHTVTFLVQTGANAIYLGLSAATDRSFSLQIDGVTYEASESSTLSTGANATYWWPDRNSAWTAGQEVSVTITSAHSKSARMPQRPQAPPRAFFHHIPRHTRRDELVLHSIQIHQTGADQR